MKSLIDSIREVQSNREIREQIETRLLDFQSFQKKDSKDWFTELCFCILAANNKSLTSWNIQREAGYEGFVSLNQDELASLILKHKHRFHHTRAKFIIEARQWKDIKTNTI